MTKQPKKKVNKIDFKEAFAEYARKEMEFIKNSDPEKLYHRVIPNIKEKDKGTIDFLYKKIIIGGQIYKDTITLNKLKVTREANEDDVPVAIAKVMELEKNGDMHIDNQLKQYNINYSWMPDGLKIMSMSPALWLEEV